MDSFNGITTLGEVILGTNQFHSPFMEVFDGISVELSLLGFVARRSDTSFRRATPYGVDRIRLGYVSHPAQDIDIEVSLAIRHDAVEDLCNQFTSGLDEKLKRATATIAGQLTNVTDWKQDRWPVATSNDVAPTVLSITHAIKLAALPYFVRFSSLEEVVAVCSSDEPGRRSPTSHSPNDFNRAKIAIAAAFILGNRELCRQLIEQKTDFLQNKSKQRRTWGPNAMSDFLSLANSLRAQLDQPSE